MDQITVAGHPDPIPVSPVAASLLQQRLETVRETRGAAAADHLEHLVGTRIGQELAEGMTSIDLATMRSIVDFVETPAEEEDTSTLGRMVQGLKDKAALRGTQLRG